MWRAFIKDLAIARLFLPTHKKIQNWKWIQGIENEKNRFFVSSIISAHLSSLAFPVILTPFDVVKTRVMCDIAPRAQAVYTRCFKTMGTVFTKEYFAGLYQGLSLGMANSLIQNVALLTTSHFLSSDVALDFRKFFVVNTILASLLYPLDTIT